MAALHVNPGQESALHRLSPEIAAVVVFACDLLIHALQLSERESLIEEFKRHRFEPDQFLEITVSLCDYLIMVESKRGGSRILRRSPSKP